MDRENSRESRTKEKSHRKLETRNFYMPDFTVKPIRLHHWIKSSIWKVFRLYYIRVPYILAMDHRQNKNLI